IQQHQVGFVVLQGGHGIHTVFGGEYFHAVTFQQARGYLTYGYRVIHHQNARQAAFQFMTTFRFLVIQQSGLLVFQAGLGTDHGWQVENDNHRTVTQNGTARHTHHAGELRAEGFYHNFPRAQQTVDLQGKGCGAPHQQDRQWHGLGTELGRGFVFQHHAQVFNAVIGAGVVVLTLSLRLFIQRLHLVNRHPHNTLNVVQRYGVQVVADFHHQRAVDRYGERQTHHEAGTHTGFGLNFDRAAHLFNFAGHHVHADASAGNLGNGFGGRETGLQNKLQHFLIRQLVLIAHQATFNGFFAHGGQVNTATVVGHGDQYITTVTADLEVKIGRAHV